MRAKLKNMKFLGIERVTKSRDYMLHKNNLYKVYFGNSNDYKNKIAFYIDKDYFDKNLMKILQNADKDFNLILDVEYKKPACIEFQNKTIESIEVVERRKIQHIRIEFLEEMTTKRRCNHYKNENGKLGTSKPNQIEILYFESFITGEFLAGIMFASKRVKSDFGVKVVKNPVVKKFNSLTFNCKVAGILRKRNGMYQLEIDDLSFGDVPFGFDKNWTENLFNDPYNFKGYIEDTYVEVSDDDLPF